MASLGDKADQAADFIKVDGKALGAPEPVRYLLLYKPRQVMTTCDDPEGRPTVADLVRPILRERVYPVGRLDYHSEGLLIVTNDGELASRVAHPRHGVVREYLVKIVGDLDDEAVAKVLRGTVVEGRRVVPLSATRESALRDSGNSWWRITVTEGRTHEVRELLFRVGHRVRRLRRTAIGPIRDGSLRPGEARLLTDAEVRTLYKLTRLANDGPEAPGPGPGRRSRSAPRS